MRGISAGFEAKMHGVDFILDGTFRSLLRQMRHEHRCKRLFAQLMDNGQMDCFHAYRRPVCARRSPGPDALPAPSFKYRSIAFALLPTGLACATSRPAYSGPAHRNSITWASASRSQGSTMADAIERRDWRIHAALAPGARHPGRMPDYDRHQELVGWTCFRYRLIGLQHRRPKGGRSVPGRLSVGALPHQEGGGEDAHAARPAGWHHFEFYPHLGSSCTSVHAR